MESHCKDPASTVTAQPKPWIGGCEPPQAPPPRVNRDVATPPRKGARTRVRASWPSLYDVTEDRQHPLELPNRVAPP